jgi:hypothetical protein
MTPETMTELLTLALKRAADAHGLHEDPEWPSRYAEHMTRTLGEDGYRLVVSNLA